MTVSRVQTQAVARFSCLGDRCPDTCCKGWDMQVMENTLTKYRHLAPELLPSVVEVQGSPIMKRDPATDCCVKLEQGLCSIHRDYGADMLGDACRFFPRITRSLGELVVMSAALSCPESARLMLLEEEGMALTLQQEIVTPFLMKNYLPAGMTGEDALAIHQMFMTMVEDATYSVEYHCMRVSAVVRALQMQSVAAWKEALPMYAEMAAGRIPHAEPMAADPFNLLQALYGLVLASHSPQVRLKELITRTANMLEVRFEPSGAMVLGADSAATVANLSQRMRAQSEAMQPLFRRYLQAQLQQALFPFAGLGENFVERITIIGVRFATMKLLMASLPLPVEPGEAVQVIQVLSRFMDHLGDATLSLRIYEETGWVREARLRALLMADK